MKSELILIFSLLLLFSKAIDDKELILDDDPDHSNLFKQFMENFSKKYINEEELSKRISIFKENFRHIFFSSISDPTCKYGVTQFSDLTPEEFENEFLKLDQQKINMEEIPRLQENELLNLVNVGDVIDIPESFDWRDQIEFNKIGQQSTCGSCWAFSTVGLLETQYYIQYKELVKFSEQQLVDCDKINDGCSGGLMTDAYRYLKKQGGIQFESDYGTYKNKQQQCHFNQSLAKAKIVDYFLISQNEEQIKKYLVKYGPLAVGVNARYLQFYKSGIHDNPKCNSDINHAVLLVGYGVENNQPYWILKNQWGEFWGEHGYFKLARGKQLCGIHTYVSIAFLEKI